MENIDIMSALFSGKINSENIRNEPKRVELGIGIGIGTKGSYSQYIHKLSEKNQQGNGIIVLGKDIIKEKGLFSISGQTDRFCPDDVPMALITYYNVLKDIRIRTVWKDSNDDMILEQYYDIPSAHSNNYDWWSAYTVYFMGPENLDCGEYSVELTSYQLGYDNKVNTYQAELKYYVEDADEEEIDKEYINKEYTNKEASKEKLMNITDLAKTTEKSKSNEKEEDEVDVEKAFGML